MRQRRSSKSVRHSNKTPLHPERLCSIKYSRIPFGCICICYIWSSSILRCASSLNMSSTGLRFARTVLMVRGAEGVSRGVDFYHNMLGLGVVHHTDEFAELTCNKAFSINLLAVESEAQLCTAYSPSLTFEVDQLDVIIPKCIQMGAHLFGWRDTSSRSRKSCLSLDT